MATVFVTLIAVSMGVVLAGVFVLTLSGDKRFLDICFEVAIAPGNVGLTRSHADDLSGFGRSVIILIMFIGRVGPLTIGSLLSTREGPRLRYPEGEVHLGRGGVHFAPCPLTPLSRRATNPHMLWIKDQIAIAEWELSESFIRASGPGGQNVNKVSTAVELRFEAERCPALTSAVKARLKRLAGRRWTIEGAIVIHAEDTRSQAQNREIARERLADLIRAALVAPKRRVATKPTLGSQRRRLAAKVQRGELKALRGKVDDE